MALRCKCNFVTLLTSCFIDIHLWLKQLELHMRRVSISCTVSFSTASDVHRSVFCATSQEEEIISSSATLPGYSGYILKFESGDFVYIKSHSTKLITIIG